MNSTVEPNFRVFFLLNKVLMGPVNSTRDPLEKNASAGKRAKCASQMKAKLHFAP